jgi:orotate phosphoribosyltransferase
MTEPTSSGRAAFIEFLIQAGALRFGHFIGKSGREMPYFLDAGRFRTGMHLAQLGRCYADCIQQHFGSGFDVLFGPAYKGIPLAVAAARELAERGQECGFAFNRKEAKDHGEGGSLVGHPLSDGTRVLLVEDVTTAGTSVREIVPVLRQAARIELVGLVVGVDRQERGQGHRSALDELGREFSMKTVAIATIDEIVAHLRQCNDPNIPKIDENMERRIALYRDRYGAGPRSRPDGGPPHSEGGPSSCY